MEEGYWEDLERGSSVGSARVMVKSAVEDEAECMLQHAAKLLHDGVAERKVKAELMSRGLAAEKADIVAAELTELRNMRLEAQSKGREKMAHGAWWCAGGAALMAAIYVIADGERAFVVAWGAMGFGAVTFLLGLIRYLSAPSKGP